MRDVLQHVEKSLPEIEHTTYAELRADDGSLLFTRLSPPVLNVYVAGKIGTMQIFIKGLKGETIVYSVTSQT